MAILQWNIRGYYGNLQYLQMLIREYQNPLCICLQETKLNNNKQPKISGYEYITSSLNYNGANSNTAILVRRDIPYQGLSFPSTIRYTAVRIFYNKKWYTLCSIYLPPNLFIDKDSFKYFLDHLPEPYLILGDFNGRHTLWCDKVCNTRGRMIEETIFEYPISVLNNAGPTHIDPRTQTETCIDLSLCSSSITLDFSWKLDAFLHNSDHFPIALMMNLGHHIERPQKWHFNRANWDLFISLSDIENVPEHFDTVNDAVFFIVNLILNAAYAAIHRSAGRVNRRSVPWWTPRCKEAIKEKRKAWAKYRRNKTRENHINFKKGQFAVKSSE